FGDGVHDHRGHQLIDDHGAVLRESRGYVVRRCDRGEMLDAHADPPSLNLIRVTEIEQRPVPISRIASWDASSSLCDRRGSMSRSGACHLQWHFEPAFPFAP